MDFNFDGGGNTKKITIKEEAVGDMRTTVTEIEMNKKDDPLVQTKIIACITLNCANRIEFRCNMQTVEVSDGKCSSFIFKERNDLVLPKK